MLSFNGTSDGVLRTTIIIATTITTTKTIINIALSRMTKMATAGNVVDRAREVITIGTWAWANASVPTWPIRYLAFCQVTRG